MAEMESIGELCQLINGYAFKSSDWSSEGIPIVRIQNLNNILGKFNYFKGKLDKKYYIDNGALLFSWSGTPGTSFGAFIWNRGPAIINQHIFRVIPKKRINIFYLKYALNGKLSDIIAKSHGGVGLQHITKKDFEKINISVPSLDVQNKIVMTLNSLEDILEKRKQQLSKLDQLIKSRFIEMFGDPIRNEKNWPVVSLGEVAEIYIGPFGTLLHKEDYIYGSHALINPSHILEGKIYPDKSFTISEEKYIELKSYHLQKGDIVLGRRGEMGRCAVVEYPGLICGTGSMIIRPYKNMKPYFIQNIISSPGYKKYIEDKAVGGTMLNLNVRIVSEIKIPLLPINMQEKFINFLHQIDNSKLTVKQSLEKLETLKKSLMQEYFG